MKDRQTNRMGQVCRATNQEEQAPGPSETGFGRHPDLPKRAVGDRFPRVPWTTCIGRATEEKYWELSHTRHMEMGQDKELYSKM